MTGSQGGYDIIELPGTRAGAVALAPCPGTRDLVFRPELLAADVETIAEWGAAAVISLIEAGDVEGLDIDRLSHQLRLHGIGYLHLPLGPETLPDEAFERTWEELRPRLLAALDRQGRLLVACPDGRRRNGIVAARLLIDAGADPEETIATLHAARPSPLDHTHLEASVRAYVRRR